MEECITMTHKELDRFKVIKEAYDKLHNASLPSLFHQG